jgi:hypothetical protein
VISSKRQTCPEPHVNEAQLSLTGLAQVGAGIMPPVQPHICAAQDHVPLEQTQPLGVPSA